ncbi:MAG: hypothetical protein GC189_10130 [Alphaproteobacteria bacterium]|nr:hypothetical protein [Alphaproteobacteria bacterium]
MAVRARSSLALLKRWFAPKPAPAEAPPPAPWNGERVDVDAYWARAWKELHDRQSWLSANMKLSGAAWSVDQDRGLINFQRTDGSKLSAPVQIIGSWNPRTSAFSWGWDHPSVQTRLRAAAERTRWFGEKHEMMELVEPQVTISELEAWRFTAIAMRINAANGVYRGPTDGPTVFMTLGDLKELG